MPLNIINYNINYKSDIEDLEEIERIIDVIKDNINDKYYMPYKNFLKKINKFIGMMVNNFEKELEETKKQLEEEEKIYQNADDDNISINSISEYEDEDTYEDEVKKIKLFEKLLETKFKTIKNRFDFEFSKIYEISE